MKFNKAELQSSYDTAKSAAMSKPVIPVLGMIRITANDGLYRMIACNQLYQITSHGECHGEDSFDLCFPADKLGVMLSAARDEIEITYDGKNAHSKSGKSKFNFNILPGSDFPVMQSGEGIKCTGINLKEIISNVHNCMSDKDVARPYLTGVCIQSDGEHISATATNAHILASHKVKMSQEKFSVIVPRDVIKILTSRDSKEFTIKGNNISITLDDGSVLISKLIDSRYPDYQRAIALTPTGSFKVDLADFKEAIGIAAKVAPNTQMGAVQLKLFDNSMAITARSNEGSVFDTEIECTGTNFNASFSYEVLNKAIASMISTNFDFSFDDNLNKFVFQDDKLTMTMMPLRA